MLGAVLDRYHVVELNHANIASVHDFDTQKCPGWEPQQSCLEAHYELARLLSSSGPTGAAEARQVLDRLLQVWANADPVPVVVAARELRASLD